jgi:WD40 repeat protein
MKDESRFRYARIILLLVVGVSVAIWVVLGRVRAGNQELAIENARATAVQRVTDDASQRMREALSANIAARALALSDTDEEVAILLAIEALNVLRPNDTLPHAVEHAIWQTLANSTAQTVAETGQSASANAGQLLSPDGHWVVAFNEHENIARLQDLTAVSDTIITLAQQAGAVTAVAFSPNSRWLAIGSRDDTAVLYDLNLADPADDVIRLGGHTLPITAVAFSPDGRWLVTASEDHTLRLYPMTLSNFKENAIVLQQQDGTDDTPEQAGHGTAVTAVAFNPDSTWLASAGQDKTVYLWSLPDAPQVHPIRLDAPDGVVHSLAFSAGGLLTAVNANNQSTIWNLNPDALKTRACALINRNLTPAEWETHLPELRYHETCPIQ